MNSGKAAAPARTIALCFLTIIFVGAVLLTLPVSHNPGAVVRPLDALFTATSAACVTGLVVTDTAETFSVFGRCVIMLLIQFGGLGAATIGIGVTLLAGQRMRLYHRDILQESWNIGSLANRRTIFKTVLLITFCAEGVGVLLSFPVFLRYFPPLEALGTSLFHAVSSFNNAGFDLMGGNMNGFVGLGDDVGLSLVTAALIVTGGIGYLVVLDLLAYRKRRRLALQTKIVLSMTAALISVGAFLLWLVEDISPLEAFFQSVSARTAGFSTVNMAAFSNAGLMVMCLLMFIGASPASTGGGIKTTTAFTALLAAWSSATNGRREVFRRRIDDADVSKAFVVILMAGVVIILAVFALCILEPEQDFIRLLFEVISAFATVGLTAGLTPELGDGARIILILVMYIGRLGPITVATVWFFKPTSVVSYTTEHITIG